MTAQQQITERQQEMNLRFIEWQKAAKFPKANYHSGFIFYAETALLNVSPKVMKLDVEDYKSLVNNLASKSCNIWELLPLLDIMSKISAKTYEISDLDDYIALQEGIEKMNEVIQNIIKPKFEELNTELNEYATKLRDEERQAQEDKEVDLISDKLNKAAQVIELNSQAALQESSD